MADFLWGIAQHVNDPSSDLISILRRHLCGKGSSGRTETKLSDNQKKADKLPIATVMQASVASQYIEDDSKTACCSKSLEERPKCRSKYAQAENVQPQRRQASTQWLRARGAVASKATSARRVAREHRAAAARSRERLRDAHTDAARRRPCAEHRHVFELLKHWSDRPFNEKEKNRTALDGAKRMLRDMLKYFKLDKIENLPEYCGPHRIFMLYRCTNMENCDENDPSECIVK